MYTLGINAAFHDSAACIMKDGQLLAAAEDERFTHIKHGKRPIPFSTYELPYHAIDYCLKTAGIHLKDVDHVAYSFDPYILLGQSYFNKDTISLPLQPSAYKKKDAGEMDVALGPLVSFFHCECTTAISGRLSPPPATTLQRCKAATGAMAFRGASPLACGQRLPAFSLYGSRRANNRRAWRKGHYHFQ